MVSRGLLVFLLENGTESFGARGLSLECLGMYRVLQRPQYGWLSKLRSLFGSLLYHGTYCLGYPKGTPILTTTHIDAVIIE